MRGKNQSAALLFFIFMLAADAGEIERTGLSECHEFRSAMLDRTLKYCVQRSRPDLPRKTGEPVFYYMHGMGGDARRWDQNGYSQSLDELARDPSTPAFTVVSFDTSRFSFFSDPVYPHPGKSSYESFFLHELMPHIESHLGVCRTRDCRGLIGTSMGGFGALKTALRYPQLFFLAAGSSPALLPFRMNSPRKEWQAYFDRHPVSTTRGNLLLYTRMRRLFPRDSDYGDKNDPALLIEGLNASQAPSLYFDCGDEDHYGFQEGMARLKSSLERRSFPFEAHLVPGGHYIARKRSKPLLRFVISRLKSELNSRHTQ